MTLLITGIIVAAFVAAVYFASTIKGWLHRQESQIGAKVKADVNKVTQTTPVL